MRRDNEIRPYRASPRARRTAEELGILWEACAGTSPSGHITASDVLAAYAEMKPSNDPPPPQRITPLARKIAEVEGLSLTEVSGTGVQGKIMAADVRLRLAQAKESVSPAANDREAHATPLKGMRRVIADRMKASWESIPHVTLNTEADVTRLVEWRRSVQPAEESPVRPSVNDLIVKACADALRKHPELNVSLLDGMLYRHEQIHIGIAVAVEQGLLVPVIRDADTRSLTEIAQTSRTLIDKARANRLLPEDGTGGVFTVSNLGTFGIDTFTPIINPPEAAILGVGRIREQLLVHQGTIRIGQTIALSLSFDHRVTDGAPAARLLQTIKENLENPTGSWTQGREQG